MRVEAARRFAEQFMYSRATVAVDFIKDIRPGDELFLGIIGGRGEPKTDQRGL